MRARPEEDTMLTLFREGGWGMFPTLVFGVLMLLAAARYALKPERRVVPLLLALGVLTLSSGALGFVTGLMATFRYITGVPASERWIALVGVGESLVNVAFALCFLVLASIAASVGALRGARGAAVAT